MTTEISGMLVFFDEERRRDLLQDRSDGIFAPFTDALSVRDWNIGQLTIALLSFSDDTIDYIAIAEKGKIVVTSKNRIMFSSIISLGAIPIKALETRINKLIRHHFIRVSRGSGGVLPIATWGALISAVKAERPNISTEIDRLLSIRKHSGFRLFGSTANILLQEREALGISLDIFSGTNQLRKNVLGEWAPAETDVKDVNMSDMTAKLAELPSSGSSFLKGIPSRYLQEESTIQHDLFNWPGMTPLHESGVSSFTQGNRKLEVIYANRNDLEHTLGVDLIYYNEIYGLFVMVQYKLMCEKANEVIYRPDKQFSDELVRMDEFYTNNRSSIEIKTHQEFRIKDDGFMFKLVPQKGLMPASGELIKGMYIPREYMKFLIGPNGPKGPKGGIKITFENSPRYLTNSDFAAFVNAGWIGTNGTQTDVVLKLIKQFYETGRALIVAREQMQSTANS